MAHWIGDVATQRDALYKLAALAKKGGQQESVYTAARQMTSLCSSRDFRCELEAIYEAVKHGTDLVPGLERGVRYVSDPSWFDHFIAPARLLSQCRAGACAEDCDGHAGLIAALAGSLGWKAGVKAYQPDGEADFDHVYAVIRWPKGGGKGQDVGMDTTVESAGVGWEPSPGKTFTIWTS